MTLPQRLWRNLPINISVAFFCAGLYAVLGIPVDAWTLLFAFGGAGTYDIITHFISINRRGPT